MFKIKFDQFKKHYIVDNKTRLELMTVEDSHSYVSYLEVNLKNFCNTSH